MKKVLVYNLTRALPQPLRLILCDTFLTRLWGLTLRRSLGAGEGILLAKSWDSRLDSAIHMLGVWMDLGVVWVNEANAVVDVRLARSWRPIYVPARPARYILEISPARLGEFQFGDQIQWEVAD